MSTGLQKLNTQISAAINRTFDRIRGIVTRAKARFSKAIPRSSRSRITYVISQAVEKVKQFTSLATIKETMTQLNQNIQDGDVLKYFRSKKEFLTLLEPIQKRYQQLLRRMRGQPSDAAKAESKPESKLWLELTGMTKGEIQRRIAEETRFIMINSTFST